MKRTLLILSIFFICNQAFCSETEPAESLQQLLNIDNKVISAITFESLTKTINNIKINSENYYDGLEKATSRYTQTNVVAAYKDFSKIINSIDGKNDFLYVNITQRLFDLGFFTLGQISLINISDTELWHNSINELKRIYSPGVTLTYDEEIYLTRLQTEILYNNSAKEAVNELENNDKILKKSDYANYVLAIGYFETKNYFKSLNAINRALSKAPNCINYLHFKEKIYIQMGNYRAALKIINKIEKSNFVSGFFNEFLMNDKLYIMMKTTKNDKSKYYSAKLFFNTGEYQKALKEAQSALFINKKNIEAYSLIGDYYLKNNEYEKAYEYYKKANNLKPKYVPSLMGIGHYYFAKNDYSTAYDYYLKAHKYSSQNDNIFISLANCLIAKNDYKNASIYLNKALKINPNSDLAYYFLSKITPAMQEQYLRKAISINPFNEYAWLDLSELKIKQNNFKEANEYIFPVKLISPNNKKYEYLKKIINSKNKDELKSSANDLDSLKLIID